MPTRMVVYRSAPNGAAARLCRMSPHVDHIIDEALALPPQERSAVALALLDSLGGEDDETVSRAWVDEIRRRREELRSGAAQTIPWEEAKARLSAL